MNLMRKDIYKECKVDYIWFCTTLFFLGIIILFLRDINFYNSPYIYAEDGSWISEIMQKGFLYTLFNARQDYFVFGNIILLKISSLMNEIFFGDNLINLPYFIAFVSYAFYSFIAIIPTIFLRDVLKKEACIFMYIFTILLPMGNSNFEIIGRIVNVGFNFYFLCFCLLVYRYFNKNKIKIFKIFIIDVFIFVSCMTNPACFVIVGIAFLSDLYIELKEKKGLSLKNFFANIVKKKYIKCWILLMLCLAISGIEIFIRSLKSINSTKELINIYEIIEFLGRSLFFSWIFPVYSKMNNIIIIGILLLSIIYIFKSLKILNKKEKTFLLISILNLLLFITITLFNRSFLTNILNNYTTSFPDRYFIVQNIMSLVPFAIIFSATLKGKNIAKFINFTLIVFIVILYIFNLEYLSSKEEILYKSFREEIESSFVNNHIVEDNYVIKIVPENWNINIPKKNVFATISRKKKENINNIRKISVLKDDLNKIETYDATLDFRNESILVKSGNKDPQITNFDAIINNYKSENKTTVFIHYKSDIEGMLQIFYRGEVINIPIYHTGVFSYTIPELEMPKVRLDFPDNSNFVVKNIYIGTE